MKGEYDVVIIGGGPIGSIASLLLEAKGLSVALIERNTVPYPFPRAIALNGFSMGLVKDLIGPELWSEFEFTPGIHVGYVLNKDKMDEPFGLMQPPVIEGKILDNDSFGFLNWFNQPQLEGLLRRSIEDRDGITTLYGHEALVLWEDDLNFVRVQELSTGESFDISGKYLLGADGGGSFVRKQMGADLKSLGKSIHFLIVDIKAPRSALRPGMDFDAGGHQIIDPQGKRPTTFIICEGKSHGTYKETFRFEFALKKGDDYTTIQSPESIKHLVGPYLNPDDVEIVRSTIYKFNSLISQDWRVNNMFTIGDATHQTSPFQGQGLNMGIRNTSNLVEKINLVHSGLSDDMLLDSYQVECYPDSEAIIKQSLFLGGMLFNIKPHINLLRAIIHTFNGKKGKPIDLFPEFVPDTVTVDNGFKPGKANQKGYPMYNYINEEGYTRSLRTYHPTEYRIFCKEDGSTVAEAVKRVPEIVSPMVIELSDGSDGGTTAGSRLVSAQRKEDLDKHNKLFKGASYVLMAPGYTMLGTYKKGQEEKLVSDYLSRFKLNQ